MPARTSSPSPPSHDEDVTSPLLPNSLRADPPIPNRANCEAHPHHPTIVQNVHVPDDYSWLRNAAADPDVETYIAAENLYTDFVLWDAIGLTVVLVRDLFEWSYRAGGMGSVAPARESGPCGTVEAGVETLWEAGSYFYWIRYEEGEQYPVFMRAPSPIARSAAASEAGCGCIVPPPGTEQSCLISTP
ncbi:hypothetical protein BDK51DRAFT_27234 [Blyttiomyces helicus]|uniref:Peptidase S9A N-terminal domain-containing protein n=1 Tax=Blyttiomyces helicus TaxID=388810 RepID=A0A4P9W584_9FUNG|nr:hypothetical protein BDK51DRAFT_27234 [Blyttiomyces helicus]|eukprot:RKO86473.1 hypothetical protein BDK51DRAFT_27234 [Blyttiomyces helicus]